MSAAMPEKELRWMGSSKRDLLAMPEDVIDVFGFALGEAQLGRKHVNAKPMSKGALKAKGIFEVVEDDDGNTYRCMYTVKLQDFIYVLHCLQKKSKSGIKTPQADIDLIEARYQAAVQDAKASRPGAEE